jgi:hypothetical protein
MNKFKSTNAIDFSLLTMLCVLNVFVFVVHEFVDVFLRLSIDLFHVRIFPIRDDVERTIALLNVHLQSKYDETLTNKIVK